ncbi:myb-like transcription factor [Gigaspora margarita]|uniref:Myb-like transcription factor n=1 Tax=Gigaspora margarita TaxID=4874 RepID=A0A8H4AYL9_GIGMA|nr:myb-like transcription factor [Gigaspora margarita]
MKLYSRFKNLGTRSYFSCDYKRRENLLNTRHNRKWTTLEDNILLRRAIMCGFKHWGVISRGLYKRNSLECFYRWRKLKVLIDWSYTKNFFFTPNELKMFWRLVSKYGTSWEKISENFQNKSIIHCKDLYRDMQRFSVTNKQLAPISYKKILDIVQKVEQKEHKERKEDNLKDNKKKRVIWMTNEVKKLKSLVREQSFNDVIWRKIAIEFPGKSPAQCRDKWKGTWDEIEDQILKDIVKKYGNDWETVAEHIEGRTPNMCRDRWQIINPDKIKYKRYSEMERQLLKHVIVNECPLWRRKRINWKYISEKYFPNRSNIELLNYWRHYRNSNDWTQEEDELLRQKMKEYKGTPENMWENISKNIIGKTASQCRERWFNATSPELKFGRWKLEECVALINEIKRHGKRWNIISVNLMRPYHNVRKKYRNMVEYNDRFIKALRHQELTDPDELNSK